MKPPLSLTLCVFLILFGTTSKSLSEPAGDESNQIVEIDEEVSENVQPAKDDLQIEDPPISRNER